MIPVNLASVEDPGTNCLVPLVTLGQIYRCDPTTLSEIVITIPEATQARPAVYPFGRSHASEIARIIAATCEAERLAASPAWPDTSRMQSKRCA